jgi:hypothetical protein
MTRHPRRCAAALLQKQFNSSVLKRMKRNHRQSTAGHQQLLSCDEPAI